MLVAVSGTGAAPEVVDRRRLVLCDERFPRQPYHAAEGLPAAKAAALVAHSVERAQTLADVALAEAAGTTRAPHREIVGAGLLLGSARPLPDTLAAILASHPLIHTAEGVMYREVLRLACERAGVTVVGIRERDAEGTGAKRLGLSPEVLRTRLAALGKPLGPPWSQDEKLAALSAWLVLGGLHESKASARG